MLLYDGKNSIGNVTVTGSTLFEPKSKRLILATSLDSSFGSLSSLSLTFNTLPDGAIVISKTIFPFKPG